MIIEIGNEHELDRTLDLLQEEFTPRMAGTFPNEKFVPHSMEPEISLEKPQFKGLPQHVLDDIMSAIRNLPED